MPSKYPRLENGDDSVRPFRLWNTNDNELVRWRCYKYPRNAHLGALIEARWAKPGEAFEVIDIRTASLLGQYLRTPTSIQFTAIKRGSDAEET
jgi:hypothetical protein